MSIRDDFRTYLLTKSGITALVSSGTAAQIWPGFIPQGKVLTTYSAIVLNTISDIPAHDTQGANTWAEARIQVDCYGKGPDEADDLAEQVRLACDGYTGTMGSSTVHFCFKDDSRDGSDPEAGNEVRQRARHSADYKVAYVQSLPTL